MDDSLLESPFQSITNKERCHSRQYAVRGAGATVTTHRSGNLSENRSNGRWKNRAGHRPGWDTYRAGNLSDHRGDEDDGAAAAGLHVGHHQLGQQVGRLDVHVEYLIPAGLRTLGGQKVEWAAPESADSYRQRGRLCRYLLKIYSLWLVFCAFHWLMSIHGEV